MTVANQFQEVLSKLEHEPKTFVNPRSHSILRLMTYQVSAVHCLL